MPSVTKRAEANWASLPAFLLWMIKDKLDIFDDIALAAVCRHWKSASSSYPRKQSIGDGMSWIMQENKTISSSSRDFISISRKKKFTMELPEFANSSLLFSKQGWFLMRQKNLSGNSTVGLPDSLFLMNPFIKAKIQMPNVAELREYYGSFTTDAGYPKHVVLLIPGKFCHVTYRTAYISDVVWSEHFSIENPMQFEGCRSLIIIGEQVYYFNIWGTMIIYNMTSQTWKKLTVPMNEIGVNYIVEHEGHVMKLFAISNDGFTSYSLSMYNDADNSWQKLNNVNDMSNTSMYVSRSHNCFCVRDKGLKAYVLHPNYGGLLIRRGCYVRSYDVLFHDFVDGSTKALELPYQVCPSAKWVDIG